MMAFLFLLAFAILFSAKTKDQFQKLGGQGIQFSDSKKEEIYLILKY